MKFRKVMAVILAAALTFSMAACGEKPSTDGTPTTAPSTNDGQQAGTQTPGTTTPSTTGGNNNEIVIGTWWLHGEGNGNPLQYSCLETPMDRGAW